MKVLEILFLIFLIVVPIFFIIITIKKIKKFIKNRNFRNYLLKAIICSIIINGILFGIFKLYNRESNVIDTNDDKISTSKNLTKKGYEIITKNGVTFIEGYLIVNKTFQLPPDFIPTNTHKNIIDDNCPECIDQNAYTAYINMINEAPGLTFWIASGYRSFNYQNGLYNSYVKRSGKEAADTYSARPGHSEHQTGLAFDLNTVNDSFADTKEGKWINENCYKYGFIIRYPKNKDNITGYKYEPWHLRYVGIELSTKLYNDGDWLTMEEYFGIDSQYQN